MPKFGIFKYKLASQSIAVPLNLVQLYIVAGLGALQKQKLDLKYGYVLSRKLV